jgi:hypothetical protein
LMPWQMAIPCTSGWLWWHWQDIASMQLEIYVW